MKLKKLFQISIGIGFAAMLLLALISISGTSYASVSPIPTDTPTPIPTPPTLSGISIFPLEGVARIDTSIKFTVVFTDPGALDIATWFWGDGLASTCPPYSLACTIDPGAGGVGTVTGSHTYSTPGVYTVQAMVTDIFGRSDTSTFEYVIVYDPEGGFVTGGGWIDSPAGAYKADPSLTGKATFGFVSKYKKGATRPSGKTEFQFQAADLHFHSDTYQWLVVNQNGSNAQFKGNGTINGAVAPNGNAYQFMIWASDGEPDTFRVKIWYEDGDSMVIVYDNGFKQPIGGGSIQVHAPK